jgi:V8-like Glu-specific endopeptidase
MGEQGNLQAINPNSSLIASDTRETLEARRYACVCSVIVDRSGKGSGFLIADDLVMTSYHVVFDTNANKFFEPSRIKCRFNFFTNDKYQNDEDEWIALPQDENEAFVAYSPIGQGDEKLSLDEGHYVDLATGAPHLDYAILRLTSLVGKNTGQTPLNLEVRPLGWIAMDRASLIGQKLSVFQFPERVGTGGSFTQQPQQTSDSTFAQVIANGLRARYDASTRHGSSGAPVFDGTTLVGLHNAGRAGADTADNRFVPIDRILEDIASRAPQLYHQLVNTRPPPIVPRQGAGAAIPDGRVKHAIDERVRAAETFVDREQENNLIQVKLRGRDVAAVHINHVAGRRNDDEIDRFVDRIRVGAAQTEALSGMELTEAFLCGSNVAEAWRPAGMTWPAAETPPDQVRNQFRYALEAHMYASRTLVVIAASDLAKRSAEEERTYMKILGEECARYVLARKVDSANAWQALQILVVYTVAPGVKVELAKIVPLWTKSPPPYCGASIALPKVRRDDIEAWRININEAWKNSNTPIEFPTEFDPETKFYMAQVIGMLKAPITRAAMALLDRRPENNPP